MKRWIWAVGICAAIAGALVWRSRRVPYIEDLDQELEDGWGDDYTFV
jgi:hypothetical protein